MQTFSFIEAKKVVCSIKHIMPCNNYYTWSSLMLLGINKLLAKMAKVKNVNTLGRSPKLFAHSSWR